MTDTRSKIVTLHFEDPDLADDFLSWLSNSGEQDFADPETGYMIANFDYWSYNKNGEFGPQVNVTRHGDDPAVGETAATDDEA